MIDQQAYKAPKIVTKSYRQWLKGTVTAWDDGRTPLDGLRGSGNVTLTQDGTLRPRPSLVRYGTQFPGTLQGELFELVKDITGSKQTYLIGMFNVAGTSRPYVNTDGGAWTATTVKTYDTSASAHFCQIDQKVLIMNGIDNLSFLDITTIGTTYTITPFTALSTPAAPTLTTNTGLVGATYTVYYRITANSTVGETIASTALAQPVLKDRDFWASATENIKISWSAVASAVTYNVYIGTVSGYEYLAAYAVNGLSYTDGGASVAPVDVTRLAPVTDSTAGPKTTRGTVINGQVWMTGDRDNPRYVRYGGTGKNTLDFSPANGGGWVELGRGGKEYPVKVTPFRDNRGTPGITVLCSSTNGKGKRYILSNTSTTLGTTVIDFIDVVEDNGQDGTDSPDAVVLYNDSLWYPSRDGFKTTGTKPQLQNVLTTDRVSNTILSDIKNLNSVAMANAVGLGFEGKIYFAVPNGASTNNEIWTLDLDRGGAWMKPWSIAATWLSLYNDNSGNTHFLIVKGNILFELTYALFTTDDGVAIPTSANSGLIKFSENGMMWAKVIDVTFFVQTPQGQVNFSVAGKTEDSGSALTTVGTGTFTSTSSIAGWSEAAWGSFGWSDTPLIPTSYGDVNKPVVLEVDEELNWFTWELDSNTIGTDFQLSDVIARYVETGIKEQS
ncbi:MAG: hypothetical protein WCJ60_04120 [bacterium]